MTPRYLESLASKTLLVGDLPPASRSRGTPTRWRSSRSEASDDELADELDRWIRDDAARDEIVERAYAETLRTETSERKAEELVAAIAAHLRGAEPLSRLDLDRRPRRGLGRRRLARPRPLGAPPTTRRRHGDAAPDERPAPPTRSAGASLPERRS